ncbi:ArsR family transcriptional regulator [Mongoliitalea lutea]|uniref:Transcriptional regulator n=1 Tax=Mongoliitalea lutea TaxID=849756 RepID=A0A8J3G4L3_9BACT|nr:ArsR family transcriptional regulator [Mongoliitalea lutea]GHB31536.1 transcriptional regulator [Mongoliitalea lutea]
MLDSLITSKTRLKLLVKFFVNEKNQSHLRGLAEEFGESTNAIRKELIHLTDAGFLIKSLDKNKIEYQANKEHPLYQNLQDIIRKYLGLDKVLEAVLERMGDVRHVVLIGDYAKGVDSGVIELNIIGDDLDEIFASHLHLKIEKLIRRKVKINLLSEDKDCQGLVLYSR